MKIQKVIRINNIGKFHNYSHRGDVIFSDVTLIYGENGRGKTTLSTIFRSLKTGDATLLIEKKCAGESAPIFVSILLENKQSTQFDENSGTWSVLNPSLEIFDSYHVNNNVYSGDHVDHNHKKNLYYLVIGEQGVRMAQEIEQIDADIKDVNEALRSLENQIKEHIQRRCQFEKFIDLPKIDDIDGKITEVTHEIQELEKADRIQSTDYLAKIKIPQLRIEELRDLLEKSLDTVSEEAKLQVIRHFQALGGNSESWLKDGIDYIENAVLNICPLCQQILDTVDIIRHFKAYFTQAYDELKQEINSFYDIFESDFANKIVLEIQSQLHSNANLVTFWGNYLSLSLEAMSIDTLGEIREKIFALVKEMLSQKNNSPLEIMHFNENLALAIATYQKIVDQFDAYNKQVDLVNKQIREKKSSIRSGNLEQAKQKKLFLESTQIRHSMAVKPLCDQYICKKNELNALKANKQEKINQLKTYSETVLEKYRTTINDYLMKFGAEFEIVETKTSLQGGKPSATYMLRINNITVPLGTVETVGEPCFRTILSDGDKNSLAFAFFMAQLKLDPDIATKTLIIDDPITSLDIHRKNRTFQEIREIVGLVKQTIILSHDAHFLKLFWEKIPNAKTFQIIRDEGQSILREWDIQQHTLPSYLQDCSRLENYLSGIDHDLRGVARCIRPVLEGYLRSRFPKYFGAREWLGDFIKKINSATPGSGLEKMQPHYSELIAICEYSNQFHHQQNLQVDNAEISETELKSYVNMTLSFIDGI